MQAGRKYESRNLKNAFWEYHLKYHSHRFKTVLCASVAYVYCEAHHP